MNVVKKYWVAVFGITIVSYLVFTKSLKENMHIIYRTANVKTEIKLSKRDIGLDVKNILNFPYPEGDIGYFDQAVVHLAIPSGSAITDLNQDEFADLCITIPDYENSVRCFINENGQHFTEVTEKLNLKHKVPYLPSAVYSADFNNDGLADLLIVNFGKHRLLLRDLKRGFVEVENPWFSNAWGANINDFNNDGLPDVIFANYYPRVDLTKNKTPWMYMGIADDKNGDHNEIWVNKGNGKFEVDNKLFNDPGKEHSTSVGVADFDRDGATDIYVGNDDSVDRMYSYNAATGSFVETTDEKIPKVHHGFSSMNSEVFDFNKDGYLDFFVSEVAVPPIIGGSNILWIWNNEKKQFEQKAKEEGVDRCGYSWTAKSVDFNLDGENELIAASGFHSTATSKINLLFFRANVMNTPPWFHPTVPIKNPRDFSIVTNARPCLFYKKEGHFIDISESTLDWNNFKASRSLTVFDFNNDGKTDVIIPEHDGVTPVFMNETETNNHWVGLVFVDKHGGKIHFGIKGEVFNAENNKSLEYFEFDPANGFKTQSDYRKVIGLKDQTHVLLKIYKDGQEKTFNLRSDKYNEIKI
jgi:hypothetical protein